MQPSFRFPGRVVTALAGAWLLGAAVPGPAPAAVGDPTLTLGLGRTAVGGELEHGFGDVEELGADRFFLTGAYGFDRHMDLYGKLGYFSGSDTVSAFGSSTRTELTGFTLAAGVRGDLQTQRDWHLGALGQIAYNLGEAEVTTTVPGFGTSTAKADADWFAIEAAGAASFRGFGAFVPYGGLKLGYVTGDVDDDFLVTLFGGGTYAINRQWSVGGELRIIDDDAIAIFARYAF